MPPKFDEFNLSDASDQKRFKFDEFVNQNKVPIASALLGMSLLGGGIFFYKQGGVGQQEEIEVIGASEESTPIQKEIVVEIAGEVEKPGVYKLNDSARIEDALIVAGGYTANADRDWAQKYVNRAAKLTDGQKLYIPKIGEQLESSSANNSGSIKVDQSVLGDINKGLVNINSASLNELDALPGIGQVYGQSIIEHRPYSSVEELLSKGALKQNVYEKIKDKVSIY